MSITKQTHASSLTVRTYRADERKGDGSSLCAERKTETAAHCEKETLRLKSAAVIVEED